MNFIALFAAFATLTSALAAPAAELDSRQLANFPQMVTVALTSKRSGTFIDRTNYGNKKTPRLEVDASKPAEKQRYAFESKTDPKAFSWIANGKKIMCTLEVKASPSSTFINVDLDSLYVKGLKNNVGGDPITTNCFDYPA